MSRLSILFLVVCACCLLENTLGFNYYIQTGGGNPGLLTYPLISPFSAIWGPDCDKKKEGGEESGESGEKSSGESGEKSSGESGEKSEGSSESSGEESKESKEGGESKEEGKSEESEGSSEEGEGKKKEGSEESGEKKKEEKKKKYVFPARTYDFPPNKVQQIIYSPLSSYSYVPYKTSYVVQQPVAPYPVQNSYRYLSVPATAAVVNGYQAPVVSRLVNSPITKIVYSSGLSYPQVPKTVVSPGARIYSVPGSWNSGLSYYK